MYSKMLETHYLALNLAVLPKGIFFLRENIELVEVQCLRLLSVCHSTSVWNCPTDWKAIYYIKTSKVIMFPWISWNCLRWVMPDLKEKFQRNEETWNPQQVYETWSKMSGSSGSAPRTTHHTKKPALTFLHQYNFLLFEIILLPTNSGYHI